ncbi:MAG: adenylosuccinate synthase [Rickettsiales bacterium]|jgi:adenylosuccinate synthase|nr:adenylosuccinate synthase [Rickettsiales bacterium]
MTILSIVGLQWGDEGKGKIVDYLTQKADVVVRFQGGNNAGHTIIAHDIEYKLNLLPSSIISPNKVSIIGNGVVIDPFHLEKEVANLQKIGVKITSESLIIADNACLILPIHKIIDSIAENLRSKAKIGTTGKGIGPAYADKVSRLAIRVCDLSSPDIIAEKSEAIIAFHKPFLEAYDIEISKENLIGDLDSIKDLVLSFQAPIWKVLDEFNNENKTILYEGAQGVMLDIDHGTYPYVTSSNTVSHQSIIGSGFGFGLPKYSMGVVKAYTTRVGEGPMPTELQDQTGKDLQLKGHEFGTVTGRERRCGWIDLAQLNQMIKICGINSIALTKIDVLSGMEKIQICTHYQKDGVTYNYLPSSSAVCQELEPQYQTIDGWSEEIVGIKNYADLPANAKSFIEFVENFLSTKIDIISTGPKREDTIILKDYFK